MGKSICEKIISKAGLRGPRGLQGPVGPQGPQGIPGISNVPIFYSFKNESVDEINPNINLETPVTEDGDYVVELQLFAECNEAYIITTSALKDSFLDLTNDNYQQQHTVNAEKFTYTHTAKITGLQAGQNIGFMFSATGFVQIKNGSLVITKI